MDSAPTHIDTIAAHLAREPMIGILGVDYLHLRLDDGSDLYITEYGRPFSAHLLPENHYADKEWFDAHSVRLPGTSALYRIPTKPVDGMSRDIVLKWNRMGQDIPGETRASDLGTAEFNSPFEEFSLVIELRNARTEAAGQVHTHRPLAIYVPRRYVEAERMGRRRYRIEALQRRHQEITLDLNRQYAVIYEWIPGIDAAEACGDGAIDEDAMKALVLRSRAEMDRLGFRVRDSKPHHIIVRPGQDAEITRDRQGDIAYALVDFELLERTPRLEQATRESKRKSYLFRQAHRFEARERFPPGQIPVKIMGVDYVHGQAESTSGSLWVVGRDPVLFEYFLPEKWRKTPRAKLSEWHDVYYTVTKDNIHLVWQVSRVGKRPDADPSTEQGRKTIAHGYNGPFEEIALSMELSQRGIETTYPRAVYMTGHGADASEAVVDNSRFESRANELKPDGHPILSKDHVYMTIWGYWNGPDEQLAVRDEQVYKAINVLDAHRQGLITDALYERLIRATAERLAEAGMEHLDLVGNHLLLSLDSSGKLAVGADGLPMVRLCNFELLRRHTAR